MVFGQNPNNYSLLVELLYIVHTGNRLHMCGKKKRPINTHPHGHTLTFFQAYICWLFLFLAVLICTVSDAVSNYRQRNPHSTQGTRRWHGIDSPGHQYSEASELASGWQLDDS